MKRALLMACVAVLASCRGVTDLCACSPIEPPTAIVAGTVTDPAAAPVAGAAVKLRPASSGTCAELGGAPIVSVPTSAAGRFRHRAYGQARMCFRLWAEPPQGSALAASDTQFVRIEYGAAVVPDSVELAFRLR